MWPKTGRKSKKTTRATSAVPTEVQDYYEAGRRDRRGIAWLLGLITLIVTILLALLLFFGGRWIYRKVTKKDNAGSSQTINQPAAPNSTNNNGEGNTNNSGSSNSGSSNEGSTNNSSATTNGSSGSATPGSSTSSTSGSNSAPLPRTGPDQDL